MQTLRDSRPRFKGAVTKIATKLDNLKADEAAAIAHIDLSFINMQINSMERTEKKFYANLEDTQEYAPEDADELATFQEEEEASADAFDQVVAKTREKAQHLLALKKIQRGIATLNHNMESLEASLSTRPDADYSSCYAAVELKCLQLTTDWEEANLPMGHALHKELEAFTGRLHHLTADVSSAKYRSIPTPVATTHPLSAPKPERSITKLPPITLPTFHGDVLKWPTFWNQFVATVDSSKELPDSIKLSYLRRAIKDPEAELILNPSIDGPDTYGRLVKELHLRYRRTKKIHRDLVDKLIQLPSAKYNSSDLRKLMDAATNSLECLQTTGHFTLETFISSLIYSKLPYKLQVDWDKDQPDNNKVVPYHKLFEYVTRTAQTLSDHKPATTSSQPTSAPEKKPAKQQQRPSHQRPAKSQVYAAPSSAPPSAPPAVSVYQPRECRLCKPERHAPHQCPKWLGLSLDQRLTQVRDLNLCNNCLVAGHATKDCRSRHTCHHCHQRHHTTVHKTETVPVATTLSRSRQLPDALLMTAQVLLKGPSGHQIQARAFLDPGAGLSIVTNQITQILELPMEACKIAFTTVQGTICQGSNFLANLTISSLNHDKEFVCRPAVVRKVTENIPNKSLAPVDDYPHLLGLRLADPTFNIPGKVDILLGADLWLQLLGCMPHVKASPAEPGAIHTAFGWVLSGPIKALHPTSSDVTACPVQPMSNAELYGLAYDFWLSESAEVPSTTLSSTETEVEKHFEETVTYSSTEKRYQVTLPRKPDCPPLGESKRQATQRYISNEASIEKRGVASEFQAQIQGYFDAGHAEPAPPLKPDEQNFYLPMHSVVKHSSTSTKLRVVFDGSAFSSTGVSLNNLLQVGPTLHPPLADILMRFRTHPIALTADIAKMYREVKLLPADRDLHRFVWRPTRNHELQDFRMTRVTFGVSASPYLAIKTLQQTAKDHGAAHPVAANHICTSFYVDDFLAGAKTADEAKELYTQLRSILHQGGFNLCKWRSSSSEVFNSIPVELQEKLLIKDATSQLSEQPKALGLPWDSQNDVMSPSIHLPSSYRQTKRGIVSDVSKTFDVLGWIAPALLPMKVLFQSLWERGQEWDGAAPPHVVEEHAKWRQQLPCLSTKKLPRCYAGHPQPTHQELHGFSDASKRASGAVVYLRSTYASHPPTVALVTAKTKVAKLTTPKVKKKAKKSQPQPQPADSADEEDTPERDPPPVNNAPRTELEAAVLLTKLLTHVAAVLGISLSNITAWTDNSAVFSWLDGRKRDQDVFTSNRVAFILSHTKPSTWKHVPGTENPADCASRGMEPGKLLHHNLWWQGPQFLYTEPVSIPRQPTRKPSEIQQPDVQTVYVTLPQVNVRRPKHFTSLLLVRSNNYQTLVCMTAWWFRFFYRLKNGRPNPDNRSHDLQPEEREAAEHWLLKQSQKRSFPQAYHTLSHTGKVAPTSRLRDLTPRMTPEGLIRVGGRMAHSELSLSQQHPIILDAKDVLVEKMFQFIHIKEKHCGPSLLLSKTSDEFYIIGARRLSTTACRICPLCRRVNPQPSPQLMGDLPTVRTKANQPVFTDVGMDFAGPYTIRHGRGQARTEASICIFICMATKAIHLEVVPDMKTPAFIRCLERFISRRNCPQSLHCDNGPNFVGARRELEAFYTMLEDKNVDETVPHYLLRHKIKWNHIPAASPHFGGLWESAVRSMKKHLKRIMGPIIFTYEELATITCQVEACLNSRPLLPLTRHNPDGITPLTPAHFIFLNSPNAYPVDPTLPPEPRLLKRWNQCQAVVHHFWDRWSREYLHTLQMRTKWQKPQPNLEAGDVVIYKPKENFACRWPIARVIKTYPGEDGLVRTALIKPPYTEAKKRPVTKLSLVFRKDESPSQTTPDAASPGSMSSQEASTTGQRLQTSSATTPPADETIYLQPDSLLVPAEPATSQTRTAATTPSRRTQPPRACKVTHTKH